MPALSVSALPGAALAALSEHCLSGAWLPLPVLTVPALLGAVLPGPALPGAVLPALSGCVPAGAGFPLCVHCMHEAELPETALPGTVLPGSAPAWALLCGLPQAALHDADLPEAALCALSRAVVPGAGLPLPAPFAPALFAAALPGVVLAGVALRGAALPAPALPGAAPPALLVPWAACCLSEHNHKSLSGGDKDKRKDSGYILLGEHRQGPMVRRA